MLLHGVEQQQAVVLHHLVFVAQRLVDFADPAANGLRADRVQVQTAQQRGGGHARVLVHDGLLDVALYLRQHGGLGMIMHVWGHVEDAAKHAQTVCAEQLVFGVQVLQQRANDDNHLLCRGLLRDLLDEQVRHAAKGRL